MTDDINTDRILEYLHENQIDGGAKINKQIKGLINFMNEEKKRFNLMTLGEQAEYYKVNKEIEQYVPPAIVKKGGIIGVRAKTVPGGFKLIVNGKTWMYEFHYNDKEDLLKQLQIIKKETIL